MRSLAAFCDAFDPDVLALTEVESGDALALATRFARQWLYRGNQALFWKTTLRARRIHDAYLPFSPLHPFERRGLLRIDLESPDGQTLAAFATAVGDGRDQRIRETRYVRTQLRMTSGPAILFARIPVLRTGFKDLDFRGIAQRGAEHIFARGVSNEAILETASYGGIGTPIAATVHVIP